jgi:predicted RNase H-like HicB family nuclease
MVDIGTVKKVHVYVKGAGWYPAVSYVDGTDHVVEFVTLHGCIGVGNTYNEAVNVAARHGISWIEVAKERGEDVPAPSH